MYRGSKVITSLPTVVFGFGEFVCLFALFCFTTAVLGDVKCYLIVVLISISLTNDVEHLFMYLLAT